MLRKNHLRKITLQEIIQLLGQETKHENIHIIHHYIQEKNQALAEKKHLLQNEIQNTRVKIQKAVKNLNGRVSDRIDKKVKVVMDKDSRPKPEDIAELMELYSYMEHQDSIIERNHSRLEELSKKQQRVEQQLEQEAKVRAVLSDYEAQYQKLRKKCEMQDKLRRELMQERDYKRNHYAHIATSIQDYRIQYHSVENNIRDKERQLIQLVAYYEARITENQTKLKQLPQCSLAIENQLLRAQSRLNQCATLYNERLIRQVQGVDVKS